MPLLFEINHPAHIHLFKNLATELEKKEITTQFLIKSDPVIEHLAGFFGLSYIKMGAKGKGLWRKYLVQLGFVLKTILLVNKTKARLGLGVSMTLPMVSKFTRLHSIGFDDDDVAVTPVFAKYANKANVIITPSVLAFEKRSENHFTYPGYHELAYLHPNRFRPDPAVWGELGLEADAPYFILRFNSFKAHHDIGIKGLSIENKNELVNKLSNFGKVYISGEADLEQEFQKYQLPTSPEKIHSVLFFATMLISDSQTMTSEAAVLGTPALRMNSFVGKISYLEEEENKYGLTYGFLPDNFKGLVTKINELLSMSDLKDEWQKRRQQMLNDKIDVTAFWLWFVENYPSSIEILKKKPDYAKCFK